MIRRGNGKRRVAPKRLVGDQRAIVPGEQKFACLVFESRGPLEGFRRMPSPRVGVQIVNEVSASDDQNPFVA